MTDTTTKSTAEKAREAGAKTPADKKKAATAKVKAMRAEAAEGDVVVELRGEIFTVHVEEYQTRMSEDYEFMELASSGILPALLNVLVGMKGHARLKDLARDEETGKVSPEVMSDLFQELMEAAGQGN